MEANLRLPSLIVYEHDVSHLDGILIIIHN